MTDTGPEVGPVTALDLDALDALLAEATPGRWGVRESGHVGSWTSYTITPQCTDRGGMPREAAALIVAAVRALPQLLRIARAAQTLTVPRMMLPHERYTVHRADFGALRAALTGDTDDD